MINIEEKILEVIKYTEDKRKVIMRVDPESRKTLHKELTAKGLDLLILYDHAFRNESSPTTIVPCVCLKEGHISYYRNTCLTNYKVSCEGCRVAKYKKQATDNGFTYIKHRKDGNLGHGITIACNVDGEIKEVSSSALANNIGCLKCTENKYRQAANNCGFEYMGRVVRDSKKNIVLRCNHDGQFRMCGPSELLVNKVRCAVCQVNSYKEHLKTKNCIYVRHYYNKKTVLVVYLNENGETFEVSVCSLLRGKFAITKDTHWNQRHSVYCIKANDGVFSYVKIGTANNPSQRLKDIELNCESTVLTLEEFKNRYEANALESELHCKLSNFKVRPEDIQHIIGKQISRKRSTGERVKVKDGVTEWFYSDAIPLLKELGYLKD